MTPLELAATIALSYYAIGLVLIGWVSVDAARKSLRDGRTIDWPRVPRVLLYAWLWLPWFVIAWRER